MSRDQPTDLATFELSASNSASLPPTSNGQKSGPRDHNLSLTSVHSASNSNNEQRTSPLGLLQQDVTRRSRDLEPSIDQQQQNFFPNPLSTSHRSLGRRDSRQVRVHRRARSVVKFQQTHVVPSTCETLLDMFCQKVAQPEDPFALAVQKMVMVSVGLMIPAGAAYVVANLFQVAAMDEVELGQKRAQIVTAISATILLVFFTIVGIITALRRGPQYPTQNPEGNPHEEFDVRKVEVLTTRMAIAFLLAQFTFFGVVLAGSNNFPTREILAGLSMFYLAGRFPYFLLQFAMASLQFLMATYNALPVIEDGYPHLAISVRPVNITYADDDPKDSGGIAQQVSGALLGYFVLLYSGILLWWQSRALHNNIQEAKESAEVTQVLVDLLSGYDTRQADALLDAASSPSTNESVSDTEGTQFLQSAATLQRRRLVNSFRVLNDALKLYEPHLPNYVLPIAYGGATTESGTFERLGFHEEEDDAVLQEVMETSAFQLSPRQQQTSVLNPGLFSRAESTEDNSTDDGLHRELRRDSDLSDLSSSPDNSLNISNRNNASGTGATLSPSNAHLTQSFPLGTGRMSVMSSTAGLQSPAQLSLVRRASGMLGGGSEGHHPHMALPGASGSENLTHHVAVAKINFQHNLHPAQLNRLVGVVYGIAASTHASIHSMLGNQVILSWNTTIRVQDPEQQAAIFLSKIGMVSRRSELSSHQASTPNAKDIVMTAGAACGPAVCYFASNKGKKQFTLDYAWEPVLDDLADLAELYGQTKASAATTCILVDSGIQHAVEEFFELQEVDAVAQTIQNASAVGLFSANKAPLHPRKSDVQKRSFLLGGAGQSIAARNNAMSPRNSSTATSSGSAKSPILPHTMDSITRINQKILSQSIASREEELAVLGVLSATATTLDDALRQSPSLTPQPPAPHVQVFELVGERKLDEDKSEWMYRLADRESSAPVKVSKAFRLIQAACSFASTNSPRTDRIHSKNAPLGFPVSPSSPQPGILTVPPNLVPANPGPSGRSSKKNSVTASSTPSGGDPALFQICADSLQTPSGGEEELCRDSSNASMHIEVATAGKQNGEEEAGSQGAQEKLPEALALLNSLPSDVLSMSSPVREMLQFCKDNALLTQ